MAVLEVRYSEAFVHHQDAPHTEYTDSDDVTAVDVDVGAVGVDVGVGVDTAAAAAAVDDGRCDVVACVAEYDVYLRVHHFL